MKLRNLVFSAVLVFVVTFIFGASGTSAQQCYKIKDGNITNSAGNPLVLGFDQFGYNYQARMFNGTYDSVDRVLDGKYWGATGDYVDDNLIMKWSDDWLSNMDCNLDGKLDRGGSTGISKGWETNQVEGDYIGSDNDSHHYTYFAKIVWVGPVPAGTDPWAATRLWNEYAIIEEVYNDPFGGFHGVDRSTLAKPAGFGNY
jgi:hypothetical protein